MAKTSSWSVASGAVVENTGRTPGKRRERRDGDRGRRPLRPGGGGEGPKRRARRSARAGSRFRSAGAEGFGFGEFEDSGDARRLPRERGRGGGPEGGATRRFAAPEAEQQRRGEDLAGAVSRFGSAGRRPASAPARSRFPFARSPGLRSGAPGRFGDAGAPPGAGQRRRLSGGQVRGGRLEGAEGEGRRRGEDLLGVGGVRGCRGKRLETRGERRENAENAGTRIGGAGRLAGWGRPGAEEEGAPVSPGRISLPGRGSGALRLRGGRGFRRRPAPRP